jgi:CelD/BcsL family acetyltransferase involved in cellulose biosynthesis
MQWNLLAADAIFCLKVAYDEDLASCSPGAQLEVRAVEAFHHRIEVNWIDSCTTPDNELINRLWPDRRRIASVVVARASLVGRSALAGVRSAASLRDRRRRRAALRGVASRLPRRVD